MQGSSRVKKLGFSYSNVFNHTQFVLSLLLEGFSRILDLEILRHR